MSPRVALSGVSLLILSCVVPAARALDCSAPEGTIDFATGNLQEVSGVVTGPDSAQTYPCSPIPHGGLEDVWDVILPVDGQITVQVVSAAPGVTAFLTSACDEMACETMAVEGAAGCARNLSAGSYWLVVEDGIAAVGEYELRLVYEPEFARFDDCQTLRLPTQASDRSSDEWFFDDGATCVGHPQSRNFPDGCPFAMYVTVDCGSSLSLVLRDAEAGDVSVYDVFQGRYLDLVARAPTWGASGPNILWADPDCPGNDPNPPDSSVQIEFSSTPLCGLFRIEFGAGHAGFLWELMANCDGFARPGFDISDSICAALDGYEPLPLLSFAEVSTELDCPEHTTTYEVINTGCAASGEFEVQLLHEGALGAINSHPSLAPGESGQGRFGPGLAAEWMLLALDPDDAVPECDESLDGTSCAVSFGTDQWEVPGCASCEVLPRAEPVPPRCVDDPSLVLIDGCASAYSGCLGGGIEYGLVEVGSGDMPVFQADCTFLISPPPTTTDYFLIVRCVMDPDCSDFTLVTVEVDPGPCEGNCQDASDDDGDGLVDCDDPDCCSSAACAGADETACCDSIDNDCDGLADADDADCAFQPPCVETDCGDGLDDDADGATDCEDEDCSCEIATCRDLDCDQDGVANSLDCRPGSADTWSLPAAPDLRVDWLPGQGPLLWWTDTWPMAGNAGGYDVASAPLNELRADGEARAPCEANDLFFPGFEPPRRPDQDLYFLVRATNGCPAPAGQGWGRDSSGDPRPTCP